MRVHVNGCVCSKKKEKKKKERSLSSNYVLRYKLVIIACFCQF